MTDPDPAQPPDEPSPSIDPVVDEVFDFGAVDFPDVSEFDFRPTNVNEDTVNPNILALTDIYLGDAKAPEVVRYHVPNLLRILGTKIADRHNRFHKIHLYGAGIPFRYQLHSMLLGSSGFGKGATVEQFFQLIGPIPGEPPLFPTFEFKGGSVESMRGGVLQDRPSDPKLVQPGSIERMDHGFLHIPEFTQVADLGSRFGGSVQTLLAWADTGKMSYETISGRHVTYGSGATLVVGLQTARLNEVLSAVAGWARRALYDVFAVPRVEKLLPENRPETTEGDPLLLSDVRNALMLLVKSYAPTTIDWSPFREWLSDAYKRNLAVAQDEQMLYSMALGHHMMSGKSWTGDITITVPQDLHEMFDRFIWNKRLARINVTRRLAHEALDVLEDPYVLGDGQALAELELMRIVSARISVPEDNVSEALAYLRGKDYIESLIIEEDGKPKVELVKLKRN